MVSVYILNMVSLGDRPPMARNVTKHFDLMNVISIIFRHIFFLLSYFYANDELLLKSSAMFQATGFIFHLFPSLFLYIQRKKNQFQCVVWMGRYSLPIFDMKIEVERNLRNKAYGTYLLSPSPSVFAQKLNETTLNKKEHLLNSVLKRRHKFLEN